MSAKAMKKITDGEKKCRDFIKKASTLVLRKKGKSLVKQNKESIFAVEKWS